jgi:peptidoglycan/xylan/chitin deacetylase (PgdA/CDA1 family)
MTESREAFHWPQGKRGAVSLSFDDARASQARAVEILDRHGFKGTFYISPEAAEKQADVWRAAVSRGHEIGNHTLTHPCSGNFPWSRSNALEDYTIERMAGEIDAADEAIERMLGVRAATFAYPCGQTFVGRGQRLRSYVPLVAGRFLVGRSFNSEIGADPSVCDLAHVPGVALDGLDFAAARQRIDRALELGTWLIFVGHEIGSGGAQTVLSDVLEQICVYAAGTEHGIWMDTVQAVGSHVKQAQGS